MDDVRREELRERWIDWGRPRLLSRRTIRSRGRGWCRVGNHRISSGQAYEGEAVITDEGFEWRTACLDSLYGDGCLWFLKDSPIDNYVVTHRSEERHD